MSIFSRDLLHIFGISNCQNSLGCQLFDQATLVFSEFPFQHVAPGKKGEIPTKFGRSSFSPNRHKDCRFLVFFFLRIVKHSPTFLRSERCSYDASAGRSVLESCLRPVVCGDDDEAILSPSFSSISSFAEIVSFESLQFSLAQT